MRWRRHLIPLALAALVAGLAEPAASWAAGAASTQGAVSLTQTAVEDTTAGTARTLDVPGGGYAVVRSTGEVSMVSASGAPQWQLDTQQLYQDWNLTWQQQPPDVYYPQLAWGTIATDPLQLAGAAYGNYAVVNDVHPAAAGVLNGRPVVAVAETVGVALAQPSCQFCTNSSTWPFSVPGSSLTLGTFVSVVDARTGRMLYHELDPGYVTQVAVAGNRLIVGDETGDPKTENGIGQWGSVSTVRGLAVGADGTATQAWKYSTGVPWGRLLDVAVTDTGTGTGTDTGTDTGAGTGAGIAVAWSDTPYDLGSPRPPDGHVLLLDAATGAVRWQVRTPGYPVLAAADDQRGELAVVQQTDPGDSASYALTGLSYATGKTVMSDGRDGAFALSLAVGSGPDDGWAVGAQDATGSDDSYSPAEGRVTLTDPATGRDLWSVTLPSNQDGYQQPDGVLVTGGAVIADAYINAVAGGTLSPTLADPTTTEDSVTAFDYGTGQASWRQTGDTGDPFSLSAVAGGPGVARAVNGNQVVETYGAGGTVTQGTAGPGDFVSGVAASISGSTDLVAGNVDGDVYAFAGKALAAGKQQVLWRTHLPGPVQHIETATLGGRQVIVAAATSAIGVIDARTGALLRVIQTPGTYAWTATVISAAGTPAVVVPGTSLTAYSLATGAQLWSYAAPSGALFSDAAYADGVVAAEYSSAMSSSGNNYTPAAHMAAVGVSAVTGTLAWTAPADGPAEIRGLLYNGAFASPDIAGAGGDGVAFLWEDTDGGGATIEQVDVRNIATGALDYTDTTPNLGDFSNFSASSSLGLIATSQEASALITPSGAEENDNAGGSSGAVSATASGQQVLLTADSGVNAFSAGDFDKPLTPADASEGTYISGTLVAGDFAGNGSQQVAAMAGNPIPPEMLSTATYVADPFFSIGLPLYQDGLAVVSAQDASTSSAAQAPAVKPAAQAPSSASAPAPSPAGWGSTASAPALEPARAGTAVPALSPATVKHTVTADAADPAVTPPGYSPSQMTAYLGLTGDGKGETIAIVDGYDDPDIVSDAETFSQQYGLPGVCGAGGTAGDCFTLDVKEQSATAGSTSSTSVETSLDVEWAHALAPDATIELIEAKDMAMGSLFRGVATAAATHPAAISISWGFPGGEFSDETYYDHFCASTTTVCVTATGDEGHPGSYPAYNPAVLSVGGTTLVLGADGSVTSETTWFDSGGGQSWVEPEPAYQDKVQSSGMRQIPDVAFDADQPTGVPVYDSDPVLGQASWYEVGGTSVGAPSWSAILTDADQLRAERGKAPLTEAGYAVQKAVYALPQQVLAPVTTGPDNGFCPDGCVPGAGYDEITGLGSPRAGIDAALADSAG